MGKLKPSLTLEGVEGEMMVEIVNPNPLTCYGYLPEYGIRAVGEDWECEECVYWTDVDEDGNYYADCHINDGEAPELSQ